MRPPVEIENKGRYQRREIERWAKRYGLPMRFPGPFPFCTLKTMRAAMFCEERGKLEALVGQAFALYWGEGGAPKGFEEADEDGSVREVACRIRADPDEVLHGTAIVEAKEALKTLPLRPSRGASSGR